MVMMSSEIQTKDKHLKQPKVFIEIEVRDKDGKLLEKRRHKADTWVIQYYRMILGQHKSSAVSVNDTGGSARNYPYLGGSTVIMALIGPSGNNAYGIVVGTSDTAYDINQYQLGAIIANGSGAGQLLYAVCTVEDIIGSQYRVIRTMSNSSGGSVIVKEIGLYAYGKDTTPADRYFMIARDVLVSPVTVPNGSTLTVRYILSW